MVSVVIVNFNSGHYLQRCLRAVASQLGVSEIVVVDNASHDGSIEDAIEAMPGQFRTIRNARNVGPAVARNQGAGATSAPIILFVDPDVCLAAESISRLSAALQAVPGVAAPALFQQALARIDYGSTVDLVGYPVCVPSGRSALAVSASALATTRIFFERLGGFDERFFFGSEESDYCWRVVLAGGEISILADVVADHACGVSAAGGYVRQGQIETTAFRMVNRERNTLAMLVKCCGGLSWILVPFHVGYITAVAAGLAIKGKAEVSRALLHGLRWNAEQLPETLRRRRKTPRSRITVARATARIERDIVPLRMVMRHGFPRFLDVRSSATESTTTSAGTPN